MELSLNLHQELALFIKSPNKNYSYETSKTEEKTDVQLDAVTGATPQSGGVKDKPGNITLTSELTKPDEQHKNMVTDVKAVLKCPIQCKASWQLSYSMGCAWARYSDSMVSAFSTTRRN